MNPISNSYFTIACRRNLRHHFCKYWSKSLKEKLNPALINPCLHKRIQQPACISSTLLAAVYNSDYIFRLNNLFLMLFFQPCIKSFKSDFRLLKIEGKRSLYKCQTILDFSTNLEAHLTLQ